MKRESVRRNVQLSTRSAPALISFVIFSVSTLMIAWTFSGEVEAKFRSLVEGLLSACEADRLLERLWRLEDVPDIGALLKLTAIRGREN